MSLKKELHELVDNLSEHEMRAARRLLEYVRETSRDPVLRVLWDAPSDDEPLTPEEAAAASEAWQRCVNRQAIPWEEARHGLGDG